ncbi:hypothetical protein [Cohnella sp.]|uniref:hypothetical protein n=1 Tax=Cohnella sp. TaxID=1883426 RepID=UPI003563C83B
MKVVLLAALLFLLLIPQDVMALSCAELSSIEEAYEKYDAVVIGKVEDVTRNKENNQIKLKVIKSFKSIDDTSILVGENITWGSLWGPSETGQEYLFFLRHKDNGWENPLCSPTMKIADASDQLKYLRDKEIPLNNDTIVEPLSGDSGLGDIPSNNWIVTIIVGFVGIMGYGLFRLAKRGK